MQVDDATDGEQSNHWQSFWDKEVSGGRLDE